MAMRSAMLKHLKVSVNLRLPSIQNPRASLLQLISRNFSDEARGTFLDKSEVTDRVLNVVKNFQKVEPSKVMMMILLSSVISVFLSFTDLVSPDNCAAIVFFIFIFHV